MSKSTTFVMIIVAMILTMPFVTMAQKTITVKDTLTLKQAQKFASDAKILLAGSKTEYKATKKKLNTKAIKSNADSLAYYKDLVASLNDDIGDAKVDVYEAGKTVKKVKKQKNKMLITSRDSLLPQPHINTDSIAKADQAIKDSLAKANSQFRATNTFNGRTSEATGESEFDPGTTGIGKVVNLVTDPGSIAKDSTSIQDVIHITSRQHPFGAEVKADVDTSMTPGVIQVEGMHTLAGVRGPDVQYLIHYKSRTTGQMQWALAQDDPTDVLTAAYTPGAASTTITYRHGDDDDIELFIDQ